MFRINRRTDYAVRVLLYLAKHTPGSRHSIAEIQEKMLIPRAFIKRIVADLSASSLIETYPGPNGGLQLARQSQDISLKEIWEAIEGPLSISPCLEAPGTCPLDRTCPVRLRWIRLQDLICSELESIRLDHLAKEAFQLDNLLPVTFAVTERTT